MEILLRRVAMASRASDHDQRVRSYQSPDADVLNAFYYFHRRQRLISQGIHHHESILRNWSTRAGGYFLETGLELQQLRDSWKSNTKRMDGMKLPLVR